MASESLIASKSLAFLDNIANASGVIELFRTLPHVHFYAKDRTGKFMAANIATLLRNGMREESEIIGKTDYDFHPPEMAAAYQAEDRQVMHSRKPLLNQAWLIYDHLKIQQWFISSKIPLLDSSGKAIGIAGAMRSMVFAEERSPYQLLAKAVNHVMEHYDEKQRVPELARMSNLSVSQFDRRFRKLYQMSPSQYILRVRVNAARSSLSYSDKMISKIALECGFYDQAQLTRYFKRLTGMTPSAYRRAFTIGGEFVSGRARALR